MTKLRGYIPTMALLTTLSFGASVANAGILVSNRTDAGATSEATCEEPSTETQLVNLVKGLATFAKTGILVSNRDKECPGEQNQRTGILVSN